MSTFDLGPTLNAVEIGLVLSAFLFGIVTNQAYTYYMCFPHDRWQLKTFALIIWFLELLLFITFIWYFYTISVSQFGHPGAVFDAKPPTMAAALILSAAISGLVQSFFAERARKFTHHRYLVILCWFLSALRFLATLGAAVLTQLVTLSDYMAHWLWLNTVIWAIGATVDILIAILLCYDLAKRRRDSLQATTRLLDKLILATIETGLVTSLLSIASIICFLTMRRNLVWSTLFFCLSRVFSISLFASLTARKGVRQIDGTVYSIRFANYTTADKSAPSEPPLPLLSQDNNSEELECQHTDGKEFKRDLVGDLLE